MSTYKYINFLSWFRLVLFNKMNVILDKILPYYWMLTVTIYTLNSSISQKLKLRSKISTEYLKGKFHIFILKYQSNSEEIERDSWIRERLKMHSKKPVLAWGIIPTERSLSSKILFSESGHWNKTNCWVLWILSIWGADSNYFGTEYLPCHASKVPGNTRCRGPVPVPQR